ncbi:MAG: hypothetical protein HC767_11050 [Akkermansiaceae bacterium]|nr:hypothetical protein [Akkermansiaceae bacterium]
MELPQPGLGGHDAHEVVGKPDDQGIDQDHAKGRPSPVVACCHHDPPPPPTNAMRAGPACPETTPRARDWQLLHAHASARLPQMVKSAQAR